MVDNKYPLASLIIVFYKQEQFVAETVAGALAQTYPNLEIILSDDHSPDGTFDAIQKAVKDYTGPHKIIINRNDTNMGLVPHVNKALFELSHGEYIILNGGDDISTPNRCSRSVEEIKKAGVESMSFALIKIDAEGKKIGEYRGELNSVKIFSLGDYLAGKNISSGASRIITRKIVDEFGPLTDECPTEDSTFTFRSFLLGGAAFSDEPLVLYRVHENNISLGSNYLTKIDPNPIYKQYQKDLNLAFEKKLIDQKQKEMLQNHIDKYLRVQLNLRRVFKKTNIITRGLHAFYLLVTFKTKFQEFKSLLRIIYIWKRKGL